MRFASVVGGLSFCAILAAASAPRADPTHDSALAEQRFSQGEAAFAKGDFATAAKSFEAAYAADPHPISLFNAARSWERADEIVPAANLYRRFIQESPPDTPNRDRAIATLGELAKRLGRVQIVPSGGTDPTLDGVPVGGDGTLYTTPGSHLASATFNDERVSQQVSVVAGQSVTVVVEAPAPPKPHPIVEHPKPDASHPKTPDHPAAAKGVTPWLFVGFAGATAVSGALLIWSGVETVMDYDVYQGLSDADKRATYDGGKFQQDMTNVLIGITSTLGLVTAAVGVFAIDWGHGTLIGLGPAEVRVVTAF